MIRCKKEWTMIKREKYLSEIRGFYQSDLIKVITGVRRCGKSIILQQIKEEIQQKDNNIVSIDFEDRALTISINSWKDIVDYVDVNRKEGLCYVLLDEIQEIKEWSIAVRTLRSKNCSVFITGSNSKLLSSEFTKELSGRYVSFRIRPFVYQELVEYAKEVNTTISIADYLIWGGFPKRIELSKEDQRRYLNDLDETIVMNDIIRRYRIRKEEDFRRVANYVLISNSRIYSSRSITKHLNGQGFSITSNTVQKWITYLSEAYVIDQIPRYSRKAKKELEESRKLYNCDVALNSIRVSDGRYDLTHNLENIVYNELVFRGYTVSVFDNNGKEIDFLAERDSKKYLIQVAYSVVDEKAYNREFGAFANIDQTNKKIIITNDDIDYSTSTVQHIKLIDFLNGMEL